MDQQVIEDIIAQIGNDFNVLEQRLDGYSDAERRRLIQENRDMLMSRTRQLIRLQVGGGIFGGIVDFLRMH
uniref:Uncharacterized protein n=1 Tax=Ditylenchus dipsaci TaxID=166011 RepID=A0A915EVC5_9BILA